MAERNVVCEDCGEIIESQLVGQDGDDSDILTPAEDCPLCGWQPIPPRERTS